jgi:hypothetical protein
MEICLDLKMVATRLRFEDRFNGASNFLPWKARVTWLLKENDLWEIVDKVVPLSIDPQKLASPRRNILEPRG